jgi:hypothetical protein
VRPNGLWLLSALLHNPVGGQLLQASHRRYSHGLGTRSREGGIRGQRRVQWRMGGWKDVTGVLFLAEQPLLGVVYARDGIVRD